MVAPLLEFTGVQNLAAPTFGTGPGDVALGILMGRLFRTAIMVGGLALLLYIVWGGLSWITAGGDEKKVEDARGKITNGIIGMIFLVASIAIAAFVGSVMGIDLLNPTIPALPEP